jgi:hypothetical protein
MEWLHEKLNKDYLKDKTCYILGGGPSLADADTTLLNKEITIGVNKAFLLNPTISYSMDAVFGDIVASCYNRQWKEYLGIKVVLENPDNKYPEGSYVLRRYNKRAVLLGLALGIWPGNNSGFGALCLAIALGCKNIGLFGFDYYTENNQTHWHEGYPGQILNGYDNALNAFMLDFEYFAPSFEKLGIKITNYNPKSRLTCFERKAFV